MSGKNERDAGGAPGVCLYALLSYWYKGYLSVSSFTMARAFSVLAASLVITRRMASATAAMSSSVRPLLVTAWAPRRMPLVTKGFSGSLGIAI